jgi:hypothetical protein
MRRCVVRATNRNSRYPAPVLRSRNRAEIKLPPGAGAEITNCGSGSFLSIYHILDFQGILSKFGFAAPWSRKKYFRLRNTAAGSMYINIIGAGGGGRAGGDT